MIYTTPITSKGQINIPMAIRRILNLNNVKKIVIRLENNEIIIKPTPDIKNLLGLIKSDQKYSQKQERTAFEKHLVHQTKNTN